MWVISHPARKDIIEFLAEMPRTVSEIAALTNMNQPTVSSHLAILSKANLVESRQLGREKIYRLIPEDLEELANWLDGIMHARDEKRVLNSNRKTRLITELHYARTCYDHLAGVEGVRMLDELFIRKWIRLESEEGKKLTLTAEGESGLANLGIIIPIRKNSKRIFAYSCMDLTVRRFHLGGALGFSLLKGLENLGYLKRVDASRKVIMNSEVRNFFNGPYLPASLKKHGKKVR